MSDNVKTEYTAAGVDRLVAFLQAKGDALGRGPMSEGPCHCLIHEALDLLTENADAHAECWKCEVKDALASAVQPRSSNNA